MNTFKQFLDESKVETITAKEFLERTRENPSWCKDLTKPLNVRGRVDAAYTPITHLSPFLNFIKPDSDGVSAIFCNCKKLEEATGTFHGSVSFAFSGIEEIRDLEVINPDAAGEAINVYKCENLKKVSNLRVNGEIIADEKVQNLIDRTRAREITGHTTNDTFADLFDL